MIFRVAPLLAFSVLLLGQANTGELRIGVKDPAGLPLQAQAQVASESNQYVREFNADAAGQITVKRLPFGLYTVKLTHSGFKPAAQVVNIDSVIPKQLDAVLGLGPLSTTVNVDSDATLINPNDVSSVGRIGTATLQDRATAEPGRSLGELVNQEPGWLFEANGVLHPRGEEYETQYVVDGLPLTENRSVAYTPDFSANEVQEMSVYTAGFPAEYGRKLGGVIEVETQRDTRPGFHGDGSFWGGSFDSVGAYLDLQYGWGKNTVTVAGSAAATDRYLDPPALANYTNHGSLADVNAQYERDFSDKDRMSMIVRREQSKFLVPNEIVQQQGGQRQDRQDFESAAQFSYEHIFSPNVLGDFRAMVRDLTAALWSNQLSTPIMAGQNRGYHEEYLKGTISIHAGHHEIKTGVDADFASLEESLSYLITNPAVFDPDTPPSFNFYAHAPDREQGAFAQDEIRWKNVTVSAGLRFDHYSLLVNQVGWSPRLGIAVYWPWAKLVFRGSYDRIFQTPPFENILVASSPDVTSLSDQVLRLPVQPARGNYYQAGFGRGFFSHIRATGNFYWRGYRNYPDDDLLLNTGVSFPITFARANIYGAEAKLEIPHWGHFSGYASYSNMRGNGYFPVTGGLFIGDSAAEAISSTSGVFPISQDQRNTVRARFRYDLRPRVWAALGGTYDSGLPIDFDGTYQDAAAEYGQAILNRVNFSDHRPRPLRSLNASLGVTIRRSEAHPIRFQIDGTNLTNEINVIDFAGLFSGTAIGITRSVNARLQFGF